MCQVNMSRLTRRLREQARSHRGSASLWRTGLCVSA
ncbi:hypothetical protein PFWH6_1858 [Pseudomonas fluorescens WH6]|nr:hypothetical protein PFWH6_1858 [Pseudomonas fluorescens WH6]